MLIDGKFVHLRALEEIDLSKLKELRNMSNVRKHTREYKLLSMINQKEWFKSLFLENPPKNIMFTVLNKSKLSVGICGLTYIDWKNRNAEISIILDEAKKNLLKESREVIKIITDYGFDELGLHRIWAEIFEIAPERIKLFEKMNFKKEGKLRDNLWRNGKWYNSFIYSKLAARSEHGKTNKTF